MCWCWWHLVTQIGLQETPRHWGHMFYCSQVISPDNDQITRVIFVTSSTAERETVSGSPCRRLGHLYNTHHHHHHHHHLQHPHPTTTTSTHDVHCPSDHRASLLLNKDVPESPALNWSRLAPALDSLFVLSPHRERAVHNIVCQNFLYQHEIWECFHIHHFELPIEVVVWLIIMKIFLIDSPFISHQMRSTVINFKMGLYNRVLSS